MRPLIAACALVGLLLGCEADPVRIAFPGELGPSERAAAAGEAAADAIGLSVSRGMRVVIDMHSTELDPRLLLLDERGRRIAEDDDGGTGEDALLVLVAPSSGRYTIVATTSEPGQVGEYTLRVQTER